VVADLTLGRLICGTASVVDRTYVWTDYAYDDTGASATELGGGAAVYPDGAANAADLIQLQIRLGADGLHIRAVLQTLDDPSRPVLAVGFDTDRDPTTGAATFPGEAWNAVPPLGIELLVVVTGAGGELRRFEAGSWATVATFPSAVDVDSTTVETTVPIEHLDPSGVTWRAFAAVGLARDGVSFLDGGGPIYDLAFVGGETASRSRGVSNSWQDRDQADILAGRYSSERAAATIDFAALADGACPCDGEIGPGYHTFLYCSELDLGGGVRPWPETYKPELWTDRGLETTPTPPWKIYAGRYQPYGVYIPDRLPTPAPLVVFLHGTGSNHLAQAAMSLFGPGRFNFPAIVVSPLGRGGSCGYFGAAEQDVVDVMADIGDRFAIDEDRVILTGISQGGFGTFRLGELYPDRFCSLIPLVGQSALLPEIEMMISGGEPFMPDAIENLCNLPVRMINGRQDPLKNGVAGNIPDLDAFALRKLRYDFRYWQMLRRGHEVVPELSNAVYLDALEHPRDKNPARVVLSVEPFLAVSDARTGLELRHDSAYWVSGVTVRGDGFARGDKGTVDVTSLARADRVRVATDYAIVDTNKAVSHDFTGRDFMGPNPATWGFDEWVEQGITLAPGPEQPVENGFAATFTRVAAVTLDLDRMSLDPRRELTLHIAGDGPTSLTLRGAWPGKIEDSSTGEVVEPDGDTLTIARDFTGSHEVTLTPAT
jgi:pimeloyl-ACP methyl ester carboxylesterase